MAERSIAEIIGWQWHEDWDIDAAVAGGHVFGTWWVLPDGSERDVLFPPTVDDMLAWLHGGPLVHPEWNPDGEIASIHPTGNGGWAVGWYCAEGTALVEGPTVHAAVEAAVRAVAEST